MKRLNLAALFLLFILGSVLPVQAAITALDGFNPDVNGTVAAVAVQSDGKILIGGDFTQVGGVARNRIARLNTDGSLDISFNPNANNSVEVLAAQADGTILVAGLFSTVGGASHSRLALLNADGTASTNFTIAVTDGNVVAIAVEQNGNVLIGGTFTDIGGTPRNHMARLNKSTPWVLDATFNPDVSGGTVYAIDLQADGAVVIGGSFTHVGGAARSKIAQLKTDGSLESDGFAAPGFSFGINDEIYAITVHPDGDILIGGSFTLTQGVDTIHNLARTSFNGALKTGFKPEPNDYVDSIVVQTDGRLLVGGGFTGFLQAGTPARSRIARVNYDSTGSVDAGFAPGVSDGVPATNVYAIVQQADGKIIVGGNYDKLNGTVRNNLSRLYLNGALEVSFNPNANISGTIHAIAVQSSDGKILVGGNFTAIGGLLRNNLARFNADGTPDPAFNPNVNGPVYAIALQGNNKIVIGGLFTQVGGADHSSLARLAPNNGVVDAAFTAGVSGTVYALAKQTLNTDEYIIVGGAFSTPPGNLARVKTAGDTGTLDTSFDTDFSPVVNNDIYAVKVQDDGHVLIGGAFTSITKGGVHPRNGIARLDKDTGIPQALDPDANLPVYAIEIQPSDGKILIGGLFTTVGINTRSKLARLNTDGSVDTGFGDQHIAPPGIQPLIVAPTNEVATVNAIAVDGSGNIVFGGLFATVDGTVRNNIARLTSAGTLDTFDPNAGNTDKGVATLVRALAIQSSGSKIILGGNFTTINGTVFRNHIARVDSAGLNDTGFDPGILGDVNAFAFQPDGKIIVGGDFTYIGGQPHNRVARINQDGTLDITFNPNVTGGTVNTIAIQSDGKILIGGAFTTVGGSTTRNGVARLDATGAVDTFDPNVTGGAVNAIAIQIDGNILIGGAFTTVGTGGTLVTRNRMARLDGTTGVADSFNPNMNNDVHTVAIQSNGKILIGGAFTTVGTGGTLVTRNRMARLDGTTEVADSFNPNMNNDVHTVAIQSDGKILVGGAFTTVGSLDRNRIARLNSSSAAADDFDPNVNDSVNAIAIQANGQIIFGGAFTCFAPCSTTAENRERLARVSPSGTFDTGFAPTINDIVKAVGIQSDGKILIGGSFSTVTGRSLSNIARLTNTEAATQSLDLLPSSIIPFVCPSAVSSVQWTRGQAAPELSKVEFAYSTDLNSWTSAAGARMGTSSNWNAALSLPAAVSGQDLYIRATGYSTGGQNNGSASLIELTKYIFFDCYKITVNKDPDGISGAVTSSPAGINNCSVYPCEARFPSRPEVTLTASPADSNSFFYGWLIGSGTCTGAASPCSLTLSGDTTLIVTFKYKTFFF